MALIVRTASDPKPFVDSIRREVLAIDAEQPIYDASTMVDVVVAVGVPAAHQHGAARRVRGVGAAARGGRHLRRGVVHASRSARASSASGWRSAPVRGDTLRLVLRRSMLLVAAGTVVRPRRVVRASTRVMAGLLYDVSPLDPLVFVGVSALLAAAGFVASLIPARRATRVDPIVALRNE